LSDEVEVGVALLERLGKLLGAYNKTHTNMPITIKWRQVLNKPYTCQYTTSINLRYTAGPRP
jgi:hypothetical protein